VGGNGIGFQHDELAGEGAGEVTTPPSAPLLEKRRGVKKIAKPARTRRDLAAKGTKIFRIRGLQELKKLY
jgi:hypothetical protein